MATYYVSAPGTTLGGAGTVGDPWTHLHYAMAQLRAGDTLKMNAGTYTASMIWSSLNAHGGWHTGTSVAPITVEPLSYTADTTRGVPAGTTAVSIQPTGVATCINMAYGMEYWRFRGITLDGVNLTNHNVAAPSTTQTFLVSLNNGAANHTFRNIAFKDWKLVGIEFANSGQSQKLHNNVIEYCSISNANSGANDNGEITHCLYLRTGGNVIQYNDITNGRECGIQFFASNGAGYAINDNTVRFNTFHDFPSYDDNNATILFSLNCNRNKIYGNLIETNPGKIAIDLRGGSGISGAADGNIIAYNTIANCLTGISISTSVSGFTNTIVKKNISYNNTTNYVDNGTGTVFTGNSTDGTNPVFTGADDFTLSAGSPAGLRAESTLVGSGTDDFDITGATRDATNPSLGAYEYDAATTPEPPINVYPNPGGYAIDADTAMVLAGLSVTQAAGLTTECWLSLESTNATWTAVDTSGGATSN